MIFEKPNMPFLKRCVKHVKKEYFKYILISIILISCKTGHDKEGSVTRGITTQTDNLNLKNKKTTQESSVLSNDGRAKTKLFLLYNANITESEFNDITEILIGNGKVEKIRSGWGYELKYLFPYCENSKGGIAGENYDRFKLQPVFTNGLLTSIKLSGIEYGAYARYNNKWVYCIYKKLMEKYHIDFIYEGDTDIEYSQFAQNNDEYDPIDRIEINKTSNQNILNNRYSTKPTYIEIPEYLKDRSRHLMPHETKTIFKYDNKIPEAIDPIVIHENDKIILIHHNWILNQSTSYSLMEKRGYGDLDFNLRFNHMEKFIRNSKLKYYTNTFHLNIILEYTTREEYRKRQSELKENSTDETVQTRDISDEL